MTRGTRELTESEFVRSTSQYWVNGDIYNAWMNVYEYTGIKWVKYVVDTLELEPLVIPEPLSLEERSRVIREQINEKMLALETPAELPSIEELKSSLKEQLAKLTEEDRELVPWLVESCETALSREVDDSPLTVALLGEFSSGKSRLINALLGENLLSVGLVPVTRSVTKIRYEEQKIVTLEYDGGKHEEIPLSELRAYIDERKKSETLEDEIKEVVIEYPAEVLKRIELWDTPGFNSNNELHDQVATQLLSEADVVVWAMASHQIGSKSESKLLKIAEKLKGRVVAVLNQVDRIGDDDAINEQLSEALNHYQDFVTEVIPTSAKWIERGEERGNLEGFVSALQRIGEWSRDVKHGSLKKIISTVISRLAIYHEIKSSNKQQRLEADEAYKAEYIQLKESWSEVDSHRKLIHHVQELNSKLDIYFRAIIKSPRLSEMYAVADQAESQDEALLVFHLVYNLQHTYWNIGPKDHPTPWKDDYISHLNRAVSIDGRTLKHLSFQAPTWPSFLITIMNQSNDIQVLNRYSIWMNRGDAVSINIIDLYLDSEKFVKSLPPATNHPLDIHSESKIECLLLEIEKILTNSMSLTYRDIFMDFSHQLGEIKKTVNKFSELEKIKREQIKIDDHIDNIEKSIDMVSRSISNLFEYGKSTIFISGYLTLFSVLVIAKEEALFLLGIIACHSLVILTAFSLGCLSGENSDK